MFLPENDDILTAPLAIEKGGESLVYNQYFLTIGIICSIIFITLLALSIWRFKKNEKQKL